MQDRIDAIHLKLGEKEVAKDDSGKDQAVDAAS